ncbi:zinc finger HIT domain-containing protein 3 [Drosophila busckii]|nr:zinc finger HIT domain-containing protein 3 [Drosophila busckii]
MECVNCAVKTNKYKCSKCLLPYCSVNCYKTHKESPECARTLAKEQPGQLDKAVAEEPTIYPPFSTEDTLTPAQLEQLGNNGTLRDLLCNPHLRSLLQQIDVSHNAQLAMTAAMQEPLFIEFANACLQEVEPMSDQERAELELCS